MIQLSKEELVMKDLLKRTFYVFELLKMNLEDMRTSDTVKRLAATAKANKVKSFIDIRKTAADLQRSMQFFLLEMKKTMNSETMNAVIMHMAGDEVAKVGEIIDQLAYIHDVQSLEDIRVAIDKYWFIDGPGKLIK